MSQQKPYDKIALVLQGGGALGSYQAGVYNALCEGNYMPDWISGTSIGAINGAIIASNTLSESPKKLDYFWQKVARTDMFQDFFAKGELRKWYNYTSGVTTLLSGNPSLFVPRPPYHLALQSIAEKTSFYDPNPLRKLLQEIIDFDIINKIGDIRLTINAVNVTTGEGTIFDNRTTPILLDHIMACAALPPAFPAVRIGNDLYWDGGVLSNTPLAAILSETPHQNILCFMIDLFNPHGKEPNSLSKVLMRQKEISYASASDSHIAEFRIAHNLRRALHQVIAMLPEEERYNITTEKFKELGENTTMHIVHFTYRPHYYEWDSKDYDFSSLAINEHFMEGYLDAHWALKYSTWLDEAPSDAGVIIHEIERGKKIVPLV